MPLAHTLTHTQAHTHTCSHTPAHTHSHSMQLWELQKAKNETKAKSYKMKPMWCQLLSPALSPRLLLLLLFIHICCLPTSPPPPLYVCSLLSALSSYPIIVARHLCNPVRQVSFFLYLAYISRSATVASSCISHALPAYFKAEVIGKIRLKKTQDSLDIETRIFLDKAPFTACLVYAFN